MADRVSKKGCTGHSLAIVCKYGSAPNEGVLTKVYYLGKYLAREGVDVTLIISDSNHTRTGDPVPGSRDVDGVMVRTVKTPTYKATGGKRRVWSWVVFELKVFFMLMFMARQTFYLGSSPSLLTGMTVRIVAWLRRSKYIFDVRDIWPLSFTEDSRINTDGLAYRAFEWIERAVTRDAAWIMSSIPRLDLYNREVLGMDKPFVFFPISVDEDIVQEAGGPDFKEPGDSDRLVIGYCGSIGVTNNLDPLIETIEALRDDDRFLFKIVGKGALKETYRQRLAGCDNVIFYDAVPRDQIWRFNEAIDVGYVSTHDSCLWRYGQSLNKLVEYMNGGVPVVMSYPESGYRTMLNEAGAGRIIPANDTQALREALEGFAEMSSDTRAEMGARAVAWIEQHRRYAPHVKRFYDAVFNAQT
jgi:glycosyltransferase involved in cell wall biosynthesis